MAVTMYLCMYQRCRKLPIYSCKKNSNFIKVSVTTALLQPCILSSPHSPFLAFSPNLSFPLEPFPPSALSFWPVWRNFMYKKWIVPLVSAVLPCLPIALIVTDRPSSPSGVWSSGCSDFFLWKASIEICHKVIGKKRRLQNREVALTQLTSC